MNEDRVGLTSLPQSPCDHAEAWLWGDLNVQGALTATQAITSLDAIAPIDQILDTLPQSDSWHQPIGQIGPMENIRDWIWRAHWLSADRLDGSPAPLDDANLPNIGGRRLLHVSIYSRLSDDDIGWLDSLPDNVIAHNVTELDSTLEQYRILASQDELTGLLNRRFFQVEAQRWIDMLSDEGSKHLALLMFDLNYFRSINDSYGHERGDQLLQEMARRLQNECVTRPLLIARMGGDEFAILMETDNKPK
ncbi:GGDEF domain-containing protein [Halothiobacillus sp.]|uniref:GGDEF domain-containing protein n=1 Tax=Halothiobacillus sp. TaxID=1891311 RepID=UPI0026144B9B|nr:GGDEF domain-containing protein [Halothiobacillus sp.]